MRSAKWSDDVKRLANSIGSDAKTCVLIVPGAEHNEDSWRVRLPTALQFLFGSGSCQRPDQRQ